MPGPVLQDAESNRFVMDFSASVKTDLLLGTIKSKETASTMRLCSSPMAANECRFIARSISSRSANMCPGGMQFRSWHSIVGDQVPSDFAFGTEHTVFHLTDEKAHVAPLICFEDTIGDLTRQFVLGGANLLANVTNDGWFLRSAGSQQHLDNAVFRCVETRRPMVRAANTGVTCFINEFGRITQLLMDDTGSQFTEGVLTSEVAIPTGGELTFYVRHGELFAKGCVGVSMMHLSPAQFRSLGEIVREKQATVR